MQALPMTTNALYSFHFMPFPLKFFFVSLIYILRALIYTIYLILLISPSKWPGIQKLNIEHLPYAQLLSIPSNK